MAVTIATHMGHQVARQHNLRNPKVVSKEEHIRKDGEYAVWFDMSPKEAYQRIFGGAVQRYNEKQDRNDRKIKDYYNQVQKDVKKHAVYECIIGVYPQKGQILTKQQQKEILLNYVKGWAKANPHLQIIGCYWHADEAGEPHIHIDYIPWSDGYKNGPERQTGLVRALEAQGFHKQGRETAQMQWTKSENKRLEDICKAYGLEVVHPLQGKHAKHMNTRDYKYHREQLEKLRQKVLQGQATLGQIQMEIQNASKAAEWAITNVEQFKNCQDVFQWMEDQVNPKGQTMFELYCDRQGLDYQYWVENTHIEPNPKGGYISRSW